MAKAYRGVLNARINKLYGGDVTCSKVLNINKPFARKIQILTVMEQRSRFGKKPKQAAIAKACKNKVRRKHGRKKT